MKAAFPVAFLAQFAGKSRASGDFQNDDGDRIEYGEKYMFLCESPEGLAQTIEVPDKMLLEIGYDAAKAPLFEQVEIRGQVSLRGEGREVFGRFKPLQVTAKKTATA